MSQFEGLLAFGKELEPERADTFRLEVARLLERRSPSFPGTQPITMQRFHLSTLMKKDFLVYEKTDGVRCLLYISHRPDLDEHQPARLFLITRKNQYYAVQDYDDSNQACTDNRAQTFDTTILDGEAIFQKDQCGVNCHFLAFDSLLVQNQRTAMYSHSLRRQKIRKYLAHYENLNDYARQDGTVLTVRLKTALPAYKAGYMLETIIPSLPHPNDGLVFVGKDSPYVFGTDRDTFKWKAPHQTTLDLRVHVRTPGRDSFAPTVELQVYLGHGRHKTFAYLPMNDCAQDGFNDNASLVDGKVVECFYDASGIWTPQRRSDGKFKTRLDKLHANHATVASQILENVKDPVTEDQIIAGSENIRIAWMTRRRQRNRSQV